MPLPPDGARWPALSSHLGFAIVMACAYLPLELGLRVSEGAWTGALTAVGIAGAQLSIILPATLVSALMLAGNAGRAARLIGGAWAIAVMAWAGVDLFARTATGNRAEHYLEYLAEPDVWHWAGGTERLGALAAARGVSVALCAVVALATGTMAGRLLRRRVNGVWSATVAALWLGLLIAGLAVDSAVPRGEANALAAQPSGIAAVQQRADAIYARHFAALATLPATGAGPSATRGAPAEPRPDIVVVVCDGLRADALNPEVMPRLSRWAERGTRFDFHHATANRSDWGMFSLVYGLPPLHYARVIRGRVAPTLPLQLRQAGYATHYLSSSADQRWMLIGHFLRAPYFDVSDDLGSVADDWQGDRAVIERAAAALRVGGGPKLLLLWLVATHYPYSAPAAYDALDWPAADDPIAAEHRDLHDAARPVYLRSARFLDDTLADWLEQLDPRRTAVVVTADHGESLYEDGTFAHGSRLSAVQTRVPLLLVGPGVPAGRRVDRPTSHLDVVPTALALAGVPAAARHHLPGEDLLDAAAVAPGYAVAYQPTREHRTLQDVLGAGHGAEPREVLLASGQLRVSVRLDPTTPRVTALTRLDDSGLPSSTPLTSAEVDTALAWLDDHLARGARAAAPR